MGTGFGYLAKRYSMLASTVTWHNLAVESHVRERSPLARYIIQIRPADSDEVPGQRETLAQCMLRSGICRVVVKEQQVSVKDAIG